MSEEIRSYGIVGTLGGIAGMIIATAYVGVDGQPLRFALDGKVVHLQILQGFLLKGETCAHLSLPVIAIHNHSPGAVIQLDGTATGCINLLEEGAVSLSNILNQLGSVRIELAGILGILATEQFGKKLSRSRNRLLCLEDIFAIGIQLLKLLYKEEILDKRMILAGNLAGQLDRTLGCLLAMKQVAMLQFDMLHAIESPHKVEMPIAAAELAIGDIRQAMRLLLTDDLSNQPVFYGAKVGGRNLSISKLSSRFLQLCRAQIAAHCLKMYISYVAHIFISLLLFDVNDSLSCHYR